MAKRLKMVMGLQSVKSPRFTSEAGFVEAMNAQVKDITDSIVDILNQFEDATPEVVMDALEPTFEKSKLYCPKDTHELVESGYLEVVKRGKSPYVEMGYAKGGKPRYAVYVHEMTGYKHEAPTRSKWLQHAVQEDLGSISSRLSAGYAAFMNGNSVGRKGRRKK